MKAKSPPQNKVKLEKFRLYPSLFVFSNLFLTPLYRSSLSLHAFSLSVSLFLFPSPTLSIDPSFNILNNFSLLFNLTSFKNPEFH